jgi:hypothetical protein
MAPSFLLHHLALASVKATDGLYDQGDPQSEMHKVDQGCQVVKDQVICSFPRDRAGQQRFGLLRIIPSRPRIDPQIFKTSSPKAIDTRSHPATHWWVLKEDRTFLFW